MKEITIRIPDDSSELLTELVERLGGSIDKKEVINKRIIKSSKNKKKVVNSSDKKKDIPLALFGTKKEIAQSNKKLKKEKIDHTYLFGKWKDFDIDIKKIREELWRKI